MRDDDDELMQFLRRHDLHGNVGLAIVADCVDIDCPDNPILNRDMQERLGHAARAMDAWISSIAGSGRRQSVYQASRVVEWLLGLQVPEQTDQTCRERMPALVAALAEVFPGASEE